MAQILVVDDDSSIRAALGRHFERQGSHRAFFAQDGVEALRILEREAIDFALIDLDIPRMSGIELVERCQRRFPELLFAVMSGYDDVVTQANQELRLRPVLLRKPFELEQVDGLIAAAAAGEMWARVRTMGPYRLRRGGWYQVEHDASDGREIAVKVCGDLRRVPRSAVTLAGQRSPVWSIVQQDPTLSISPAGRAIGERYAVCPNCLFRSALADTSAELHCPECGGTFPVDWRH